MILRQVRRSRGGEPTIGVVIVEPVASPEPECTIEGTESSDLLYGTSGDDVICGLGGDDILLGVGGNDVPIAGSALLTESLPEAQRVDAQGLADVMMSLLGATAAFSSGFVKTAVGYEWLANFATAAAVLILIGAIRTHARLAIARVG